MESDRLVFTEWQYHVKLLNDTGLLYEFKTHSSVHRNVEVHEHLGIQHMHDEYHKDHPNGRVFHFKIIDKQKYLLAKIKYGF
jgi:hypothetical protein